ncbi:hypothetical protein EVAR_49310_1 [Eumeta japonica]|uniref:Uncharacterized protein n=1 Tax=Eumeta variegata TaxID=151549 RepID=A0A4C1YCD6_EUMVA|nr:hypothetical protein EVAR_49310_1 [Eumeta japonica]
MLQCMQWLRVVMHVLYICSNSRLRHRGGAVQTPLITIYHGCRICRARGRRGEGASTFGLRVCLYTRILTRPAMDRGEGDSVLRKLSRVSASSWGLRYKALKVVYKGTFVATVAYVAGCCVERAPIAMLLLTWLRHKNVPARMVLLHILRDYKREVVASVIAAALRRVGESSGGPLAISLPRPLHIR